LSQKNFSFTPLPVGISPEIRGDSFDYCLLLNFSKFAVSRSLPFFKGGFGVGKKINHYYEKQLHRNVLLTN